MGADAIRSHLCNLEVDVNMSNLLFPPLKTVDKVWGWESHLKNDEDFCVKILGVELGCCCSVHWHKSKSEMFVMQQGRMLVEVWDKLLSSYSHYDESLLLLVKPKRFVLDAETTDHIMINPFTPHRFTGLTKYPALFIECSTKDHPDDSYRAIRSMGLS